jgi:hypothetical protein
MNIKYDRELIAKARELYMDFVPVSEISRKLGIKRANLQYYVADRWKEERKIKGTELFQELSEAKAHNFARMLRSCDKIVQKYLTGLENRDEVTPQEAKVAMQVITELDKITRLDKESPTEIISNQEKSGFYGRYIKKAKKRPIYWC